MKKVLLGILGVVVGLVVGMVFNMGFVLLNMQLHPPPEGFDWKDPAKVEAYSATLPALAYLVVLLAHSSQAFVGSLVGTLVSGRRSVVVGLIIGALTLVGCLINLFSIPSPLWFAVLDVLLMIPLAWLAARLVLKKEA